MAARARAQHQPIDILERVEAGALQDHLHGVLFQQVFDLLLVLDEDRRLQDLLDVDGNNEVGIVGEQPIEVSGPGRQGAVGKGECDEGRKKARSGAHDNYLPGE